MSRHQARDRAFDAIFDAAVAIAVIATLISISRCAPPLYSDPGPHAFESSDQTALLVGCGERAAVGHLFCRFNEGAIPAGEVVVVVPPVDCKAETCAVVSIWSGDMQLAIERNIPKGQTYVVIPWTKLLGDGPIAKSARGFWPVLVKWAWVDQGSGETLQAAVIGEIRVRVVAPDYTPLTYDPAASTWRWSTGGVTFSATDKGRTAIEAPK